MANHRFMVPMVLFNKGIRFFKRNWTYIKHIVHHSFPPGLLRAFVNVSVSMWLK